MNQELLKIDNLHVEYRTDYATSKAVNGISLTLNAGENIGLVGETGAGKTTTALSVLGLLPNKTGFVTNGSITFDGMDLLNLTEADMRAIRGNKISMIFQDPMTSLNPIMTVGDQILEVLKLHNQKDVNGTDLQAQADEILLMVGISPDRKNEYPHQFSGGMRQRIMIAIAIACKPMLLIADEPTTALDVTIQAQVLEMMNELRSKLNTSLLLITHDLGIVARMCDKVAIVYSGEIVEYGTVWDIYKEGFHHPYTKGLFGSIPDLTRSTRRLTPIGGQMTDPANLPSGCKFHPRCPHCTDRCRSELPENRTIDGHMIKCHLFEE